MSIIPIAEVTANVDSQNNAPEISHVMPRSIMTGHFNTLYSFLSSQESNFKLSIPTEILEGHSELSREIQTRGTPSNLSVSSNTISVLSDAISPAISYDLGHSTSRITYADTRPSESNLFEKCHKRFVEIAKNEQIEYGFISPSEILIKDYSNQYPREFGKIIQHIYLEESGNSNIIISLLKAISAIDYSKMYPYAPVVALAAVSNSNDEVREAGIRAYEKWEHPDGIKILKTVETSWPWLEEYRLETIEYLESLQ